MVVGYVKVRIEVGLEEVEILMVMGKSGVARVVEKTWMDKMVGA